MAQGQVSLSTKGKMADVLAEALRTFPDAQNDAQALTRALFHWLHGREENSKRGAIAALREESAEYHQVETSYLKAIWEKLNNDQYDTDHA